MNYLLIISILLLLTITYLSITYKEPFITYIKDVQLVGTSGTNSKEDGRFPLSSVRNPDSGQNEEQCYGSLNVPANLIGKTNRGFCNNKGAAAKEENDNRKHKLVEGEKTPTSGMYAIDFSNYETYYEKEINGSPLTGSMSAGNMIIDFSSNGIPIENDTIKLITLSKAKAICDELGSSCAGFTVFTPTERDPESNKTIFYASIEQNSRDIYSLDYEFNNVNSSNKPKYLKNNPGAMSFIKKNPEYEEKPIVKLDLGVPKYEKKNCFVKQNEFSMYYSMNGTLEQCKSRCMTLSNPDCVGFVKNNKDGEEESSSCVFHRGIDYSEDISKFECPEGFDKKTSKDGYCLKKRNTPLNDQILENNCKTKNGTPKKNIDGKIISCDPLEKEKICINDPQYSDFAVYKREFPE